MDGTISNVPREWQRLMHLLRPRLHTTIKQYRGSPVTITRHRIKQWLKKYNITNYTIHNNLVVDVDGNVNVYNQNLKYLPFQFGKVTGYFSCSCNELTSLQYCPTTVGMVFNCSGNNLSSLQYCPSVVGGGFYCNDNLLTSLRHCPNTDGEFDCSHNQLASLQYSPSTVGGNFICFSNILNSLQYSPSTVGGYFDCSDNQLPSIQYCPTTVGGGFFCYDNPFIVTKENEKEWFEVIKNHKNVYSTIKNPTDTLTNFYKMLYEV